MLHLLVLAVMAAGGALVTAVAFATHRRRAERALLAEERRHAEIVRNLPDAAIIAFDAELRFTLAEGPALERVGWASEQLVGRTLHEALPPERARELEPLYRRALNGERFTFEMQATTGRARHFVHEAVPLADERGRVHGAMLVSRDVTEARQAEERREEAERLFERAFDDARVGMALVALDGTCLRTNAALAAMLGVEAAELIGESFGRFRHPDDAAVGRDGAARVARGEIDGFEIERRYVRADGRVMTCIVSLSLVRDANGRPLYTLAQALDISDRRRAERELEERAERDPLTGVYNRGRFDDELRRQVQSASRYGTFASVLMLDLDRFKGVNDRLGHSAGDRLLVAVAAEIAGRVRATDVVARIGGDEFAVVLPHTGSQGARRVAADLADAVARVAATLGPDALDVRASVGVATVDPYQHTTAELLLDRADRAMYLAKSRGLSAQPVA
jgi:diguanylate cyclase (GGDEF)-like protein/PAS domain S-box-containing protein